MKPSKNRLSGCPSYHVRSTQFSEASWIETRYSTESKNTYKLFQEGWMNNIYQLHGQSLYTACARPKTASLPTMSHQPPQHLSTLMPVIRRTSFFFLLAPAVCYMHAILHGLSVANFSVCFPGETV